MPQTNSSGQTFGAWVLAQRDRDGLVGQLVGGARADRKFPRNGSPEDVRKHLSAMQADGALVYDGERYYEKKFAPASRPFDGGLRAVT